MKNSAIAAAIGVTLLVAGSAAAQASPEGVWELETRDTRFQLNYCGDGSQLCGSLIWLSDAAYNEQYKPFLNQPMARNMKPVAPNVWKGDMKLFGYNMAGTITQTGENQMTLKGCAMLVVCKSYQMFRQAK